MYKFEDRVLEIRDKIAKFEGDPEYSMTDGLMGNFEKPDYVRGMTQACYKLDIITLEERDYLRMQSYKYAEYFRQKVVEVKI